MSDSDAVVRGLLEMLADEEARRGQHIDWEKHLPSDKEEYTAREVVDAIGAALTEAGIENNLKR